MNRDALITAILDRAERSGRALYNPVERIRDGVRCWVSQTREGTTVGKRFSSLEDWHKSDDEFHAKRRAEFKSALVEMTDSELQNQAEYWLKP